MKKPTISIDVKLHKQFKLYCVKKSISMEDAVTIAIQLILKKKRIVKTGTR